eukprot:6420-Heterococcus_DN1.PRE.1
MRGNEHMCGLCHHRHTVLSMQLITHAAVLAALCSVGTSAACSDRHKWGTFIFSPRCAVGCKAAAT